MKVIVAFLLCVSLNFCSSYEGEDSGMMNYDPVTMIPMNEINEDDVVKSSATTESPAISTTGPRKAVTVQKKTSNSYKVHIKKKQSHNPNGPKKQHPMGKIRPKPHYSRRPHPGPPGAKTHPTRPYNPSGHLGSKQHSRKPTIDTDKPSEFYPDAAYLRRTYEFLFE